MEPAEPTPPEPETEAPRAGAEPAPVIDTHALFGEAREICLKHEGELYRLRITRRGRLILSK